MSTNTQKLRVLRSRTDHDLLVLVGRELDRGFALVDAAATRNSPLFAQALKSHNTAMAMLLRISGLNQDGRPPLETRLKELRSRLDQVPLYANARSYPAAFAS